MAYTAMTLTCEKCDKKERFERATFEEVKSCVDKAVEAGWVWRTSSALRCPKCARRLRGVRTRV